MRVELKQLDVNMADLEYDMLQDILNIENKGIVKIDGMEWSARADEKIQKGEIVKVLRVEGVKVIVEKGE